MENNREFGDLFDIGGGKHPTSDLLSEVLRKKVDVEFSPDGLAPKIDAIALAELEQFVRGTLETNKVRRISRLIASFRSWYTALGEVTESITPDLLKDSDWSTSIDE